MLRASYRIGPQPGSKSIFYKFPQNLTDESLARQVTALSEFSAFTLSQLIKGKMKTTVIEIEQFLVSEKRAETRIFWCSRIELGVFVSISLVCADYLVQAQVFF